MISSSSNFLVVASQCLDANHVAPRSAPPRMLESRRTADWNRGSQGSRIAGSAKSMFLGRSKRDMTPGGVVPPRRSADGQHDTAPRNGALGAEAGVGQQVTIPEVEDASTSALQVDGYELLRDAETQNVYIAPTGDSIGKDYALLFSPGAFLAPEEYIPLFRKVLLHSTSRLFIAAVRFNDSLGQFRTEEGMKASFEAAVARLQSLGFASDLGEAAPVAVVNQRVFLIGHSIGAYFAVPLALPLCKAFVQIGSRFPPSNGLNMATFPKPVLSIIGERDGQIPPASLAADSADVEASGWIYGEEYKFEEKPIVVIKGMNHAQGSNGVVNHGRGDVEATISLDEAREELGRVLATFVDFHVAKDRQQAEQQEGKILPEFFKKQVLWSFDLLRPLGQAEKSIQATSVELLERIIPERFGLKGAIIFHNNKQDFVYSKPSVSIETKVLAAQAWLEPQGTYKKPNLWLKMKSLAALEKKFPSEGQGQGAGNAEDGGINLGNVKRLGAEINSWALKQALEIAHPVAKEEFEKSGKQVVFEDDDLKPGGPEWVASDVEISMDEEKKVVRIRSPMIITGFDIGPRFDGMHYVKVLTVARALDWIMLDSVR